MLQAWITFGTSVIGPGHIASGKPNQDSWRSFRHALYAGIAVSDGLGSNAHPCSHYGSRAACHAVELAIFDQLAVESGDFETGDLCTLPSAIVQRWNEFIRPLPPRDAAATCLYAFIDHRGEIRLGMLGDGCIAAILSTGEVKLLEENKEGGFSNQTRCLSESVPDRYWNTGTISAANCDAVILCTDGISDDFESLENKKGFMKSFAECFCKESITEATREITDVLTTWPTPKHTDDKTIACLCKRTYSDE